MDEEGNFVVVSPFGCFKRAPPSSSSVPAVQQPTAAVRCVTTTTYCTTTVSTAVTSSSSARSAVCVAALDFAGSFPIPAHGLTPCVAGGVRHPPAKTKVIKLVSELEGALQDKDCTMAALSMQHKQDMAAMQSKYDALYQNWEGQLTQLLWLNAVVQKKDVELFDKDLAISSLEGTVSDQSSTINNLQAKFISMYYHCTNLAKDMQKKDDLLLSLKAADQAQRLLCESQKKLAKATTALLAKNKKTKLILGSHSLNYATTEPSEDVRNEMALAAARVKEEEQQLQVASIAKLSEVVDTLAKKYDRYNLLTQTNVSNTRCDPDGLPCAVHREMMGIWLYADSMEPTQEEMAMYEFHLQLQIRPPHICSPPMPKPRVNWSKLNKFQLKNLPEPDSFPIRSCPQDPAYYTTTYEKRYNHPCVGHANCGCVRCDPPFGRAKGLRTNLGVIPMPLEPVHGYVWHGNEWVIAAY